MRSRPYKDLTPLHEWPDLYDWAAVESKPMTPEDEAIYRVLTLSRQDGGIVVDSLKLSGNKRSDPR